MTFETLDKWIERFCKLSLLALIFAFAVFLFVGMMACGKLAIAIGAAAYSFTVFTLVNEWIDADKREKENKQRLIDNAEKIKQREKENRELIQAIRNLRSL